MKCPSYRSQAWIRALSALPLCLLFLLLYLMNNARHQDDGSIRVTVDTTKCTNHVDKDFLSITIDSSVFQPDVHWYRFNFSSPKVHTLMKALAPAMLRIGGASSDWLFFDKPSKVIRNLNLIPKATVMTKADVIRIFELTRSTGLRLVFDLNLQLRFGEQWGPSNAIELLEFCSKMGFCDSIDWELGNEPDWFDPVKRNQIKLTPQQIGNDFLILKRLLSNYDNCRNAAIIGPDVGEPKTTQGKNIFQAVANSAGNFLKGLTFHHYYFRGDTATYKDYLNASHFSNLEELISFTKSIVAESLWPSVSLWLGETSAAYNSGTRDISDRFVSGFLWMEKLGLSAAMGLKVVMRQTFYGGYYALLDIDMNPNPDYWLSWLHKKLVGQSVFGVTLTGGVSQPATTRVYAHCTATKASRYQPGAVTVFALNVDENMASVLTFSGILANQAVDAYLLESGSSEGVVSNFQSVNEIRDTRNGSSIPSTLLSGFESIFLGSIGHVYVHTCMSKKQEDSRNKICGAGWDMNLDRPVEFDVQHNVHMQTL